MDATKCVNLTASIQETILFLNYVSDLVKWVNQKIEKIYLF